MPDYKTHDRIGIITSIFLVSGMVYYKFTYETIIVTTGIFLFSVFYLSPDLDTESRIYKRWKLARWIWYPYQKLMPHRGESHNIIIGPLCPVIYLIILFGIVRLIIVSILYIIEHYHELLTFAIIIFIIAMAGELHIITDRIHSKIKA